MSRQTIRLPYHDLAERINRFPQGAPPSPLLYRILCLLFTEKEAELLSRLPIRPFSAMFASRVWHMGEQEAARLLREMAGKGLLLDMEREGEMYYVLPPPMAGFFEFSLMRIRSDMDQDRLSQLFFRYLNVEDRFMRDLLGSGATAIGRVFVNEQAVGLHYAPVVLDYERATETIRSARSIAVGTCYCRHKMSRLGRSCEAPLQICMTLNLAAQSLIRHGTARKIDAAEGLDLLREAWSRNLVQCGDNVREGVNFICHCCGCCCEPLLALRRLGQRHPVYSSNFISVLHGEKCTGCGRCADVCPVEAVALVSAHSYRTPGGRKAVLHEDACLGCGVCARVCRSGALRLVPRGRRVLTPLNTAHRIVLMAIERGKLQELIFDNRTYLSHRALAALFGVIFKLPPVKQLLASEQVRSKYLERLLQGETLVAFGRN